MPSQVRRVITVSDLSGTVGIRRMSSNRMNTNSAGAVVVLGYTSTAIDVISAKVYTVEAIQGANFVLDVGVNGSKEAIVKDEAIGITGADTIVNCTVDTTRVAAGKMIIASVSTADGTGGNIAIAIEYREVIT